MTTPAILCSSLISARQARATLDSALGLPAVAINAASGLPDTNGLTTTSCDIIEALDWPTAGTETFILMTRLEDAQVVSSAGLSITEIDLSTIGTHVVYSITGVVRVAPTPTLADAQQARFAAIDARTDAIIAAGYEWPAGSGIMLSANETSQLRVLGLVIACMGSTPPPFPMPWNSLDDSKKAVITSVADAQSMFAAGVTLIETAVLSGTTLKDQVRAATTVDQVNAVADTR